MLSLLCGWLFILQSDSDTSMSQCSSSAFISPSQLGSNTDSALQYKGNVLGSFFLLNGNNRVLYSVSTCFWRKNLTIQLQSHYHLMPWTEKNLIEGKICLIPFLCLSFFLIISIPLFLVVYLCTPTLPTHTKLLIFNALPPAWPLKKASVHFLHFSV